MYGPLDRPGEERGAGERRAGGERRGRGDRSRRCRGVKSITIRVA